jgi:hypothetical protein
MVKVRLFRAVCAGLGVLFLVAESVWPEAVPYHLFLFAGAHLIGSATGARIAGNIIMEEDEKIFRDISDRLKAMSQSPKADVNFKVTSRLDVEALQKALRRERGNGAA